MSNIRVFIERNLVDLFSAGYHESVTISSEDIANLLGELGYPAYQKAIEFLECFMGQELLYSDGGVAFGVNRDQVFSEYKRDKILKRYNVVANENFVPIGMTDEYHMILLLSEKGEVYGAIDKELFLFADSPEIALKKILERIQNG